MNFKNVLTGWWNDLLFKLGKLPPALSDLASDRLSICKSNECGMLKLGICTACGCPVSKKTKVWSEECPLNMWRPFKYESSLLDGFIDLSELPESVIDLIKQSKTGDQICIVDGVELLPYEAWATFTSSEEPKA